MPKTDSMNSGSSLCLPTQTTDKMEFAIRNIITNAVTEIESEHKDRAEPLSGNEFLEALFAKMFPAEVEIVKMEKPAEVQSAEIPVVEAVAEKKKPGPKPKLDENGNPLPKKARAKKAEAGAPPTTPERVASPAPETEAPPTTPEQAPQPVDTEAPPAPKKQRAKKEKGPANLDKLTPTQTKQLKKLAEDAKVEVDKKDLLAYANEMTPEVYNATSLDEHMKAFVQSRAGGVAAPVPEPEKELDCVEVEFNGQTYYVNPEDKRVYKEEGGGHVFVGYAGMSTFAEMVIPKDA